MSTLTPLQNLYTEFIFLITDEMVWSDSDVMEMYSEPAITKQGDWVLHYHGFDYHYLKDGDQDPFVSLVLQKPSASGEETLKMALAEMKLVNDLFLADYNDILTRTGNKWSKPIQNPDTILNDILCIKKDWYVVDKQTIRMQFSLRGADEECTGDQIHHLPQLMKAWSPTYESVHGENFQREWEEEACIYDAIPYQF